MNGGYRIHHIWVVDYYSNMSKYKKYLTPVVYFCIPLKYVLNTFMGSSCMPENLQTGPKLKKQDFSFCVHDITCCL